LGDGPYGEKSVTDMKHGQHFFSGMNRLVTDFMRGFFGPLYRPALAHIFVEPSGHLGQRFR
jgi:hypothetical protein